MITEEIIKKFRSTKAKLWKDLMSQELTKRILSSLVLLPTLRLFFYL